MEERFGLEYHWLLGPWGQLHVLLKLNATLPLLHIFQWMCTTFMIHVGFCAKLKWYRILWLFCKLDLFGLPSKININCKHHQTGWNQPIVFTHPTYMYILVDVQNYSFPWHFISFFHGFDHSQQQLVFAHMSWNNITWCPVLFNFELASLYHSCSNRGWGLTSWFDLSWPSLEILSLPVLSAWKDKLI